MSHQHVTFFSFSSLQNFFKDLKEFKKTSEAKKYLILFEIWSDYCPAGTDMIDA